MSQASYGFTETMSIEPVDAIAARLETASPQEVMAWAFERFGDRVAIATGFGAEGVALIDMAVKIRPRPDVFFIDTGFLFPETYELRHSIEQHYGLKIRAVKTDLTPEDQQERFGPDLWARDPDLCCRLRKLEPLKEGLAGLDAWVTAIRRDQTDARKDSRTVEWDHIWNLVKINPLAWWSRKDVWDYIRQNRVPYNPLHERGYPSLGCTHCTRAVREGEDERAGRWPGRAKTECGLHLKQGFHGAVCASRRADSGFRAFNGAFLNQGPKLNPES